MPKRGCREQTPGRNRIGDRMLSRLAEMCIRVEMTGKTYRKNRGQARARFG